MLELPAVRFATLTREQPVQSTEVLGEDPVRGPTRKPPDLPAQGVAQVCQVACVYSRPTFSMSSQNSAATSAETVARVPEIAAT